MTDLIKILSDGWALIAIVTAGFGGTLTFINKRRTSTDLLYIQLEKLKIQVIEQVNRDVELIHEMAEKDKIVNRLKLHCPECYKKFIQSYDSDS